MFWYCNSTFRVNKTISLATIILSLYLFEFNNDHTYQPVQANAIISYNNRPASEAVPYFEQVTENFPTSYAVCGNIIFYNSSG